MLAFLSVAFFIYSAMHVYAPSNVCQAFHHPLGLGFALMNCGIVMTFLLLILWQMAKQNWYITTVVASWVALELTLPYLRSTNHPARKSPFRKWPFHCA